MLELLVFLDRLETQDNLAGLVQLDPQVHLASRDHKDRQDCLELLAHRVELETLGPVDSLELLGLVGSLEDQDRPVCYL